MAVPNESSMGYVGAKDVIKEHCFRGIGRLCTNDHVPRDRCVRRKTYDV